MNVWIVMQDGTLLDVFGGVSGRYIVKDSVNLTYSRSDEKPTLLREDDALLEWSNGIIARLVTVKTVANHL